MRTRDRAGLALAPVFLRLALAVIFIWAGLGKFMDRREVPPDQAAILANYGVIPNPSGSLRLPSPPTETPGESPDSPAAEPQPDQPADQPDADGPISRARTQPAIRLAAWTQPASQLATAADFPEPVSVSGRAMLVLGLHSAIHPGLNPDDSSPRMRLWPDLDPQTDYDPWPVRIAWAVSLTELIGGILIALGLLTRLAALGVAGVMVGALWLTGIGPAIQSGHPTFGFLPDLPAFSEQWLMTQFQFVLLCAALALFFTGAGALSLDRLLVGGPPKPPPPKPATATEKK